MPKPTAVEGLTRRSALSDATRLLVEARLLDVRRFEADLAEPPFALDPVHDMRVAARRLREALHLLGDKALRAREPAVKRLQDALGAVRDDQLLGAWLRRHGLATLAKYRERDLNRASRELAKAISRWTTQTVPAITDTLAKTNRKGKLGGGRLARRLRKRLDTVAERIGPVLLAPRPEPAHALRRAVKKLRYDAELGEPAFPALKRLQKAVQPLQESLGALHDADLRLSLVRRSAPPALLEREREARARLAATLLERLAAFKDSGIERRIRRAL